jgi:hypothetical protein
MLQPVRDERIEMPPPGYTAEFSGGVERSGMATLGTVTLGFRLKDARGKYHSNTIWINPHYEREVTVSWVVDAGKRSNG